MQPHRAHRGCGSITSIIIIFSSRVWVNVIIDLKRLYFVMSLCTETVSSNTLYAASQWFLCFEAGGLSFHSVFSLISVPCVVYISNVLHTLASENILLYFAVIYLMQRPMDTFTSPPSHPIKNPEAVTKE